MRVAKRLSEQKGIIKSAVLMGTEKNKELLADIGVTGTEILAATAHDLIVGAVAENSEALATVLDYPDRWFEPQAGFPGFGAARTLEEALALQPRSNLAVISVPGIYAGRETRRALERGLNVFLFSDNVPLEEERQLKEYARDHGLIVMGPDCGTAIIGGVGVGFANSVRQGSIGVIGATGTGIQEFTSLVHRSGSGISHAIGIGSRDLSDAIEGISFLSALESLEKDARTSLIVLLSKPPGREALSHAILKIRDCSKPVITCFLGIDRVFAEKEFPLIAFTLDEAARLAVQKTGGRPLPPFDIGSEEIQALLRKEEARMRPGQKFLRGIFAGGTFCFQAQQILRDAGISFVSNAPLDEKANRHDPLRSRWNCLMDMGADEFTSGRPHPMIDSRLRRERILAEAGDPDVGILLLDFVLGFNSSSDPAGDLAPAIIGAKSKAVQRGDYLSVIASVCGTEGDPQDMNEQVRTLEQAGAVVFRSSADAARFGASLLLKGK